MAYTDILKEIEAALGGAEQLEGDFKESSGAMARADNLCSTLDGEKVEYDRAGYETALHAFKEGDYTSADRLFQEWSSKLENSTDLQKELSALQKNKESQKLEIDNELMDSINTAISSGNYDEAISMAQVGIDNAKSGLDMFGATEKVVKSFSDMIDQAREHILIESFMPKQEQAEVLLEERKLAEAHEVGQKGIASVERALKTWRPEIEVVFPENLVAAESNRSVIQLENKGKAKVESVSIEMDGIESSGNLSTGEIEPGSTGEVVVALIPPTPGNVPVSVTLSVHRSYDSDVTQVQSDLWVQVLRSGGAQAPAAREQVTSKPEESGKPKLEAIWEPPEELSGDEEILAEFFAKRWESYRAHPDNKSILDYLHNNRERFAISSYFEIPTDSATPLQDWGLPRNLRGNVHLDGVRNDHVNTIIESPFEKNFVIIGEPGVGKTVLLFEVLDYMMEREPVAVITNENLGNAHEKYGIRLFYDDISEKPDVYNAIAARESIGGLVVSSRETEWSDLPVDFRKKFTRLTVPRFADDEMEQLITKTLDVNVIRYDSRAVSTLVSYAQGSPIYVGSLIKEMVYNDVRRLSQTYLKENAKKGMTGYVTMILQRLLKSGNEYRPGGLHTLSCLMYLANHVEERKCHEQLLRAFADEIDRPLEEKFNDVYDRRTFNRAVDYLSGEGSLVRFPHDTWVDVLQGQGAANPFRADIQEIRKEFEDTGRFEKLGKDAIDDAWEAIKRRYERNNVREKDSFLELCNTFTRNFTLSDLKEMGVDMDQIREVASKHRDEPVAASILSRIEGAEANQVTNVINIQDSVISRSSIGTGDDADVKDSVVHKSKSGKE